MAGLDKYLTTTPKKPKNPLDRYLQTNPQPNQSESLNLLDQYYKGSQQQLDANREAATQKADIAYQKAQNYMPIINKQNGLSGLGVSESATLDMYNKHMNRQSGIDSTYDSASRDLFQNYLTDRSAQLDREYQRTWNEEQRAYERAEAERLEKEQDQQREYEFLETILIGGDFSHFDDINNQINRAYWDGLISESDYKKLVQLAEAKRTNADFADKPGNTHYKWNKDRENSTESRAPLTTMLNIENLDGWTAADLGGIAFGAMNDNAVVKTPDGQPLTLEDLYDRLTTDEGMTDEEAEKLILRLQKKLGIKFGTITRNSYDSDEEYYNALMERYGI